MILNRYNTLFIRISFVVCVGFIASCSSKKAITEGALDGSLSTRRIIQNHYSNALDFDTMSGRVKIDYQDRDTEQGVTMNLRMKKDEVIWVSAPFGMFKALITPERVTFYNKLEGEFFDGDFTYLTELLGYEMNFDKVQNIFIGNTVLDLRDEKYLSYRENDSYVLKPKQDNELFKILFSLEPKYFKVQQQQLSQPNKNRFLTMLYTYQTLTAKVVPSVVTIEALNKDGTRSIILDFRSIEFGKKLNFPYKIPKGFKSVLTK